MMQRVPIVLTCLIFSVVVSDAQAQSLEERIKIVREQRSQVAQPEVVVVQPESLHIPRKMGILIDEVFFDQTPARDVFNWWSTMTEIPLVINWNGLELDGIDPQQGITLDLKTVPARLLLNVIMQQASSEVELIYEVTPWYVHVMTKRQANRNPVLRVYDVSDLVLTIPNFTDAPSFDLNDALSSSSQGSGGGGSSSGLFGDQSDEQENDRPTKNERGQNIADMVRQTIEPDIWQTNGGFYASARYFDGKLIVNAPMYVHRQIGMPVSTAFQPRAVGGGYKSPAGGTSPPSVSQPFGKQER